MKTFMIIDGSSLLYRAFYAIPPLKNALGIPTNAVYGFLNMFLKLYDELHPDYVAVTFDKGRETFRTELYGEYKANRESAPDDLRPQFDLIKEVLSVVGIKAIEMDGYEGDDLIGSLSKHWGSKEMEIAIISGDRDTLQLVDAYTNVYLTKKGITEMLKVTSDNMETIYGYGPAQVIEMKALMGDTSDNIPGIKGVGEKTALKFINQYNTIDGLYASIDEIKGKMKEKLMLGKNDAFLSRTLATIKTDIPCDYGLDYFLLSIHGQEMKDLFNRLGLHRLVEKFIALSDDYCEEGSLFSAFEDTEHGKVETKIGMPPLDFAKDKNIAITFSTMGDVPHLNFKKIYLYNGVDCYSLDKKDIHKDQLIALFNISNFIITMNCKDLLHALYINDFNEIQLIDNNNKIKVLDVSLMSYLLDPTRTNYGISYLCERFNCDQIYATNGEEELQQSAVALYTIYSMAYAELEKHNLLDLYRQIELPLVRTLAVMEHNGIYVDVINLEHMKERFTKEILSLQSEIYNFAGESFNINSPKQLGLILFEKLNLPVIKKTKTGYSTDAEVLEMLKREHPIVQKILEYRSVAKLLSTYIDGLYPLIQKDSHRIHTTFNQIVTATGRLSSSNPNLQNIPVRTVQGREIRSLFLPGPEYDYLVSADYSQIELRILAHLCEDPGLLRAFSEGLDIHRYTAAEVLGKDPKDVSTEERSHAKAVNFGIIYGISDYGLSRDLGITREEAKNYIEKYFQRYPTVKGYMDSIVEEARKTGMVKTMFGRIRTLPDINNRNFNRRSFAERTAMNTPIQGSAADIIKLAMNKVATKIDELKLSSRLLLQVHDELVMEVKHSELDVVMKLLKEEMENVVSLHVPLVVDIHNAKNWALVK